MRLLVTSFASWLSTHEYIAIWAEGIALVAIFIWDRWDSRAQHQQTTEQHEIGQGQIRVAQIQVDTSEKQTAASQVMAQSLINSERAWVMADLDWFAASSLHTADQTSQTAEGRVESTTARIRAICKNEGKTPAWIDGVYGHMEIIGRGRQLSRELPRRDQMQSYGPIGSIGAGKERQRSMELSCSGHRTDHDLLTVYVLIEYHDIFGMNRETHLGYFIFSNNDMVRQEEPERNRNT